MLHLTKEVLSSQKEQSPRAILVQAAYAMAAVGPIPHIADQHHDIHYSKLVQPLVRQFVNEVNEESAIRVSEFLSLTKQLWVQRYHAVHPKMNHDFVGLLLTKEQLPEIYLTELKEFVGEDGRLYFNHTFLQAAARDARGE